MSHNKQLLTSEKTSWGNIEVWLDGDVRSLYIQNRTAIQSQLDMTKKEKLLLEHSRAMMSFLLFKPKPRSLLLLGIGGGSLIHFLSYWFSGLNITAVDVNPQVIRVAKTYFALSEMPKLRLENSDALAYLLNSQEKQCVILVDLHDGNQLPDFIHEKKFMRKCFEVLSPGGVLVINMLVNDDQGFIEIVTTLREYFTGVSWCMTLTNQKNILLFATKQETSMALNQLHINARECEKKFGIEFEEFVKTIIKIERKTSS